MNALIRKIVIAAVALSVGFGAGSAVTRSLALFTASTNVTLPTLSAGFWSNAATWFLHNNPSPPVGNTISQVNLTMTATAPTATTLYDYSTDVAGPPVGRSLAESNRSLTDTNPTHYVNWRSPVLASATTWSTSQTITLWTASKGFTKNKNEDLFIYLRDYNPATGTYREIGQKEVSQNNWQQGSTTWIKTTASGFGTTTVAAGHQVEVRLMLDITSKAPLWIAYDTTAYPSSLELH
jgi:hypothetical protein